MKPRVARAQFGSWIVYLGDDPAYISPPGTWPHAFEYAWKWAVMDGLDIEGVTL